MPFGYMIPVVLIAACVASAFWPLPTRGPRPNFTFILGVPASEAPFMLAWYLLLITWASFDDGDLDSTAGRIAAALAALTLIGLIRIVWQSARSLPVLDTALTAALGDDRPRTSRVGHRLRAAWALIAPIRLPDPRITRHRNISYGEAGRANLLDVYRRRGTTAGPVLVYFHPGGFFSGSKTRQSKLMLEALALRGWVCVSADYPLRTDYRTILIAAKRALAWVRTDGERYGADPSTMVVCGGSAGAHLAVTCAVSAGRVELQPGFEHIDASVSAAVGLYGYYGEVYGQGASSPADFADSALPPTLIVHGPKDPMVAVSGVREFVDGLRGRHEGPVAYAELPGAGHNFDLFASLRHAAVTTAVIEFVSAVTQGPERDGRRDGRDER